MTALTLDVAPLTPADLPQIEKLDERAFGPGRFTRTAYRLREGVNERNMSSDDSELAAQTAPETQSERFFQGG